MKADFAKALTNAVQPSKRNIQTMHVLDDGALIHRIKWAKKATYKNIAKQYVSYVRAKYGHSCIVLMATNRVRQ